MLRPAKTEAGMLRRVAAMIQSFIQLRELLSALEPLESSLEDAESELLCALRSAATAPEFAQLLIRLDGLLEDEVRSARGAFLNRTQQCFALRSGEIPLLDVARQAFCNATEAVHEHAAELRQNHDLQHLKVQYTARRGFYFSIPLNIPGSNQGGNANEGVEESSGRERERKRRRGNAGSGPSDESTPINRLPSAFCILQTNSRATQCTTDELNALNSRLRDAANDCLCLTEGALEEVSKAIVKEHMPALHRLIDGLALLDMLCGFARQLEGSGKQYVRPALTESGPLVLVGGRHPLVELDDRLFNPNDTWLAVESSLHVITGPNMAGKSTYLRQVAAAVVMAQVGCHVAADFASFTPVDRILTRIGTCDRLESNSSSFMVEMQVSDAVN